ncbi:DUF4307 domain-containing protein [Streptomyces tsukubensis]|uniref:DUF4307 domain-containing protein n=1 Tax=Streptomyces tsukubensis TaxID=83656 RepID=A0A1V4AD32_9ACTN|nr:DUF4307 domain-containing protein [Streptomyces tsukubensis]OON81432.1 hypothetical protein B1H18_08955 [Streptomyces tsukubensis]QFR95439.1 DUF4307 domain-containing protein [Streptomyces tsukubensis]
MTAVRPEGPSAGTGPLETPESRYGRTADQRADHKLKVIGAVLGVALLAMVAWFGYDYVSGEKVSAEVIKWSVVSDTKVEAHLEVRKDSGVKGYCTMRSQAASGAEVGRADFRFDQDEGRIDRVVTLRTTGRATNAELVGCHAG